MEWVNELIGFLIILFILVFPLLKKILVDKNRKKTPQQKEIVEEEEYPRIRRSPQPIRKAAATPPQPPRTQRLLKPGEYDFHSELEELKRTSEIEKRKLETRVDPYFKESVVSQSFFPEIETKKKRKTSSLTELIRKNDPLRSMVVLSEILGKPKGLQSDDEHS